MRSADQTETYRLGWTYTVPLVGMLLSTGGSAVFSIYKFVQHPSKDFMSEATLWVLFGILSGAFFSLFIMAARMGGGSLQIINSSTLVVTNRLKPLSLSISDITMIDHLKIHDETYIEKIGFHHSGEYFETGMVQGFDTFAARLQEINPGIRLNRGELTDAKPAFCQQCGRANPGTSRACEVCRTRLA